MPAQWQCSKYDGFTYKLHVEIKKERGLYITWVLIIYNFKPFSPFLSSFTIDSYLSGDLQIRSACVCVCVSSQMDFKEKRPFIQIPRKHQMGKSGFDSD